MRLPILVLGLMSATVMAEEQRAELAPQVYRDAGFAVRAAVPRAALDEIRLGDALALVIEVEGRTKGAALAAGAGEHLAGAWDATPGLVLQDSDVRRLPGTDDGGTLLVARFHFQVLGCPGAARSCGGERVYSLPEFNLAVRDESGERRIAIRVWPEQFTVGTAIAVDANGDLLPFDKYFPTAAYPSPSRVHDGRRMSAIAAGVAAFFLSGGLLMWPFFSRRLDSAPGQARWRSQLERLEQDPPDDEARYYDALRRCLLWYCHDELELDPFIWLELAEAEHEPAAMRWQAPLRELFSEVLNNPPGRGDELRARLVELTARTSAH